MPSAAADPAMPTKCLDREVSAGEEVGRLGDQRPLIEQARDQRARSPPRRPDHEDHEADDNGEARRGRPADSAPCSSHPASARRARQAAA